MAGARYPACIIPIEITCVKVHNYRQLPDFKLE